MSFSPSNHTFRLEESTIVFCLSARETKACFPKEGTTPGKQTWLRIHPQTRLIGMTPWIKWLGTTGTAFQMWLCPARVYLFLNEVQKKYGLLKPSRAAHSKRHWAALQVIFSLVHRNLQHNLIVVLLGKRLRPLGLVEMSLRMLFLCVSDNWAGKNFIPQSPLGPRRLSG